MSGRDQGGEDKGFLARWSQRKREAEQPEPKQAAAAVEPGAPSGPVAADDPKPESEFDLSSLPKLEDLTGTTDITAFLRKGVPEHLRNEALRKSWALDPAIRNYVNPALEYAYDWNSPGGVPGGGELGAGIDVARMVLQIMGGEPSEPPATAANPANAPASELAPSAEHDLAQPAQYNASQEPEPDLPAQALRRSDEPGAMAGDASDAKEGRIEAGQAPKSEVSDPAAPQQAVRRHGSAKPTT
jgi:Protein of unknown function (DUF3306)